MPTVSPYEAALGERLAELHPTLQRYFTAIPAGFVGVGVGTFDEFGTPRRWMRPLLAALHRRGVLFAGFARSVPFRIINRTASTQATGLAIARREVQLPTGRWVMSDSVAAVGRRVVDRIGEPRTVAAVFELAVHDGALTMTSQATGLIIAGCRVRVPRPLAPVVRVTERYDPDRDAQRVELSINVPLLGHVYGYRGTFRYELVEQSTQEAGMSE